MIRVNIHDAKTHLSRYLAMVEGGESVVICRRNVPIAELRPVAKPRRQPAPLGLWKGQFEVTDAFFEPLPDDLLAAFEGRDAAE